MSANSSGRLLFFDNVRYTVIIWMTLFHVASGLSGHPEFIRDSNTSVVFAVFHGYSVTVMMAIMFFVAGYFSAPSLRHRSTGAFLRNKLLRLGLPWLVGVVFLGPTMPYMAYYSRSFAGLGTASYWDFWQRYMGSVFSDWLLPVNFTANAVFHHQHFWFLSMLLVFFAAHALLRDARRRWGRPAGGEVAAGLISQRGFARAFLLAGLGAVIGIGASIGLDLPGGTLAFFFKFSLFEMALYGAIFSLGVHAQARGWYVNGQAPGWPAAGYLALCLLVVAGAGAGVFLGLGGESPLLMLFGGLGLVLVNLLSVLGFTSLLYRHMNTPSALNANLAANSYNVYLVQYPVILAFRLLNFTWEISPFVKFVAAGVPALLVSYALSEYLIRPRPRLAVLAAVFMHVGLCVFGLPRTSFSHQLLDRQQQFHAVIAADATPVALLDAEGATGGGPPWAGAATGLAWQSGALYFGSQSGLQVMRGDGQWEMLDQSVPINRLAALGPNSLAVAGGNLLAAWDDNARAMQVTQELATGAIDEVVADGRGGFFYTLVAPGQAPLLVQRHADGREWSGELGVAGAGALSGESLLWTAAARPEILRLAFAGDRRPAAAGAVAEIFMADGKYGRDRPQPLEHTASGLCVDREGRLFLVNRVGLQVFDPAGVLLGVVQLPEVPFDCAFGGDDLSVLYISTSRQVYALQTRTAGRGG